MPCVWPSWCESMLDHIQGRAMMRMGKFRDKQDEYEEVSPTSALPHSRTEAMAFQVGPHKSLGAVV